MMRSGFSGTIASRSSFQYAVSIELMRTVISTPRKPISCMALRTSSLAASFSSGETASSRSKIMLSAPSESPLMIMFGAFPGKKSMLLRIFPSVKSSGKQSRIHHYYNAGRRDIQ
jgi:hypothetical protein